MTPISWIHLSDLHFRMSGHFDTDIVIKALLKDIKKRGEFAPELGNINFIFITGDLAYSGKESEYRLVHKFIENLMEITGVARNSIFIIPGNHDIDRSKISDESRTIINKLGNEQAVNELLENPIDFKIVLERLEGYQKFFEEHFGSEFKFNENNYFYINKRTIGSKNISILGLNSAWAAGSDQDQYNLFLGERQVREAITNAGPSDIGFVLIHHPFKWLRDSDADICEPLLLDNHNIILHGHLHRTGITLQRTPSASSMIIGAGAGYESRSHLNSYSLGFINSDFKSGALYLRTYSDRDGGFFSFDTTSYRNVNGEYKFKFLEETDQERKFLDLHTKAEEEFDDVRNKEKRVENNIKEPAEKKQPSIPLNALTTWWYKRGYNSDPFLYYNATDIHPSNLPDEEIQYWYVDPNLPSSNNGFSRPTIDEIISIDTNDPVLIFASSGGGKTFSRILAAKQAISPKIDVIEIANITSKLPSPERVSAIELMQCVCDVLNSHYEINTRMPHAEYVQHLLETCDKALEKLSFESKTNKHALIFVDDLDKLFSESNGEQNQRAINAVSDLCKSIASHNSSYIALRLFLPLEIKDLLLQNLGVKTRQHIRITTLRWNMDRCESILEARLNSYWGQGPNQYEVRHLERLFHPDALDEIRRQLNEKQITPRCVIRLIRELSYYAFKNNLSSESFISSKLVVNFFKVNNPAICPPVHYPVSNISPSIFTDRKSGLKKFINILNVFSTKFRTIINNIAAMNDQLDAIKILGIFFAVIIFFLWLLYQEIWLGQHIEMHIYLKRIWDFFFN